MKYFLYKFELRSTSKFFSEVFATIFSYVFKSSLSLLSLLFLLLCPQTWSSEPTYIEVSKKVPTFSMGWGLAFWQEQISGVTSGTTGTYKGIFYASQLSGRSPLFSSSSDPSSWSFYGEFSLLVGQANLQNQDSTVPNYFRRGAGVQGTGLALGATHPLALNKSYLGISIPLIYRQGQLDPLDSTANLPQFINKQKVFYAFCLELGWQISENWGLIQNFGTGPELRDAIWQIRFFYRLY